MKRKGIDYGASQGDVKKMRLGQKKYRRRAAISAKPLIAKISKEPFRPEWRTKLTWCPATYLLAPGTSNGAAVIKINDLYDPDFSNVFGNDQPLFTDQLMSATGPYQLFHVNSWKCKITFCNASGAGGGSAGDIALDGYVVQGATNSTDVDTFAELAASPGRQTFLLAPRTGDGSMKVIYVNGSQAAYTPADKDIEACGTYAASPTKPIYLSMGLKNAYTTDASTIQCYIKLEVEFDVTFMHRDGVAS